MLPGALSGCIGIVGYLREGLGLTWIPEISLFGLIVLAAVPLLAWAIFGLTHLAVEQNKKITALDEAWDRTDKNLISIREAMDLIIRRMSSQWPADLTEDAKRKRSAAKLRELGRENQATIWGVEVIDLPSSFQDHKVQIQPWFWNRNIIKPEYVYHCESTPEQPVVHTDDDEALPIENELQPIYADLRISKRTLEAMCPPGNS